MNKQGIYTPEQVQHTVDEYWWDEYGYEIVADRQKAEKIARQAFEWLVWMNQEAKWDSADFNRRFDEAGCGSEQIYKQAIYIIVQNMLMSNFKLEQTAQVERIMR